MSGSLRRPDPMRSEAALHRAFPPSVFSQIVYFEQAVLADSASFKHIGYRTFVVTQDAFYVLDLEKPGTRPDHAVAFTDVALVDVLEDAAQFFPEDLAALTTHIRLHLSAAAPLTSLAAFAGPHAQTDGALAGPWPGSSAGVATTVQRAPAPSASALGGEGAASVTDTTPLLATGGAQSVPTAGVATVSASNGSGLIDFYSIYEDSQLLYYLQRTWMHAKTVRLRRKSTCAFTFHLRGPRVNTKYFINVLPFQK